MILKGLKTKSIEKATKKSISDPQFQSDSGVIKSVGVIISQNEFQLTEVEVKALFSYLQVRDFNLVSYSKKVEKNSRNSLVSPKNFGWNGVLKTKELKSFSTTNFDVLLALTETVDPFFKALFALTEAKFKISNTNKLEAVADLTIQTTAQNLNVLKTELHKYLTILNKI